MLCVFCKVVVATRKGWGMRGRESEEKVGCVVLELDEKVRNMKRARE